MEIILPEVEGDVFIDGGPNRLGTLVTAEFLNAVMKSSVSTTKEIETLLKKAGITPDPKKIDQVYEAIIKAIKEQKASTTEAGTQRNATAEDMLNNADNVTVTPANLSYLLPVGSLVITTSVVQPEGRFLFGNGASVLVSQYQDLFKKYGYMYGGSGDRFNLPDFRGRFIRAASTLNAVGISQEDAIRDIVGTTTTLQLNSADAGAGFPTGGAFTTRSSGYFAYFNAGTSPTASGFQGQGSFSFDFKASRVVPTANENRPKNIALAFWIRY